MPKKLYHRKLTQKEILELFDDGVYHADLEAGKVYSARTQLEIYTYAEDDQFPDKVASFCRLYGNQGYKALPVARVIWIVGTRSQIPEGFEVHHRDKDRRNDAFDNLFCLHYIDHRKLHSRNLVEEQPF